MELQTLKKRRDINDNTRLSKAYSQFVNLLTKLKNQSLPDHIVEFINQGIEHLNTIPDSNRTLKIQLRKTQTSILQLIEKELKIVTKKHYRNMWLGMGMAAFGIPLGVAFGVSLGNMAFLGIGIPIGMAIGIAVGTNMDKKAFEEGRQIDLEIKT